MIGLIPVAVDALAVVGYHYSEPYRNVTLERLQLPLRVTSREFKGVTAGTKMRKQEFKSNMARCLAPLRPYQPSHGTRYPSSFITLSPIHP